MPENNNDFFNDLPKINNDNNPELPKTNNIEQKEQPIIEIPQSYYDKIAKEEEEKRAMEQAAFEKANEKQVNAKAANRFLGFVFLNILLIFGLLYLTINKSIYMFFIIPAYIVLLAIFNAIKLKKESDFPTSVMLGGIIVAVITFILSMVRENEIDMWTYYSIASATIGILGYIVANILTKFITDFKNIKALQTIGYLLFFAVIIGGPIVVYKMYPEEIHKIIFQEQTEVVAETESEFLLKTLKNRYNVQFTCDEKSIKHQINQFNQKITTRTCKDPNGKEIDAQSIVFNESDNKYIIIENYLDVLYLNSIREKLAKDILNATGTLDVFLYLYPENNCTFYGDCSSDDYFENAKEESDINNQYKASTYLNFEKEILLSEAEFVNSLKFKIVLEIRGRYNDYNIDYNSIINTILTRLNASGIKNTLGYDITLTNYSDTLQLENIVYKVTGTTNPEQVFNNPKVVETNQ